MLSLIIEDTSFHLNMLEELDSSEDAKKLKIDLKFHECVSVNNLFIRAEDLSLKINPVCEKKIPLHPKLFDNSDETVPDNLNYHPINIKNILEHNPERVMTYCQQGLSERYSPDNCHCANIELFIIMKCQQKAVSQEFIALDRLNNLYKSLANEVPFDLFCQYTCIFYEAVIHNDIWINFDVKGIILNATTIHDWVDFIPEATKSESKENLIVRTNNTLNLKISLAHMGIDYTP